MLISDSVEIAVYGHRFEFDFTANVTFDLDHEHSRDGWYVDDDATIDLRGWSLDVVVFIPFDETIKPVVLAAIRENIDAIMESDSIRRKHRDEIAAEKTRGFHHWEVA